MTDFLHHLFLPRTSNNHRAKFLHHQSIVFLIAFLFIFQFVIGIGRNNFSQVLGVSTNISSQQILLLSNKERQKEKVAPLILNDQLSKAAMLKAQYMFSKDYWAHNAPDGVTPWSFIKQVGYEYVYAGENLARGFTTSEDIVNAWMASQSHRENMLSSSFQEVGFAIADGKLLGEETTLVVEMLGSKNQLTATKKTVGQQSEVFAAEINVKPAIDSKTMSLNLSSFLIGLFILILALDMIIVERKRIVRVVGHNIDHILFLGAILIVIVILGKGIIL